MEQIANVVQGCVSLLARLMMVAVFLFSAFDSKIRHFSQTAEYMRSEGIPNPRLALFGAIGLILLGGLSLPAGAWTRSPVVSRSARSVMLPSGRAATHTDAAVTAMPSSRRMKAMRTMGDVSGAGGKSRRRPPGGQGRPAPPLWAV